MARVVSGISGVDEMPRYTAKAVAAPQRAGRGGVAGCDQIIPKPLLRRARHQSRGRQHHRPNCAACREARKRRAPRACTSTCGFSRIYNASPWWAGCIGPVVPAACLLEARVGRNGSIVHWPSLLIGLSSLCTVFRCPRRSLGPVHSARATGC